MHSTYRGFASETKPLPKSGRIGVRTHQSRRTSDNDDYAAFARRFWSKVALGDRPTCWLWIGATTGTGFKYGQVSWRARYRTPQKAHRVAWELTHGAIPDGKVIAHRCDVPLCCNPHHLFIATQAENLNDARRKGRLDESRPRVRTLTLADRLAIYFAPRDRQTGGALARRYRVSKAAISQIRAGRFAGAPNRFERVPCVQVPIRGELHVGNLVGTTPTAEAVNA